MITLLELFTLLSPCWLCSMHHFFVLNYFLESEHNIETQKLDVLNIKKSFVVMIYVLIHICGYTKQYMSTIKHLSVLRIKAT